MVSVYLALIYRDRNYCLLGILYEDIFKERKRQKKMLFTCEELGGVGGHKVADEFQRGKIFLRILPPHSQPQPKLVPLLAYSLEAQSPAA